MKWILHLFRAQLLTSVFMFLAMQATTAMAVSLSDCVSEQQTLVSANIDDDIFPESRQFLPADYIREKESEIRQRTMTGEIPWHVSDSNKIESIDTIGKAVDYKNKEMQNELIVLDSFHSRPWQRMADDRSSPERYKKSIAKLRLEICFFNARTHELSAVATSLPSRGNLPGPVETAQQNCSREKVEAANREARKIEAGLEAFKRSPQGQQNKSSFPHLQVLMWATEEQGKIIRNYCGEQPPFRERLQELKATFDSAYDACVAIMRDWGPCGPFSPEALTP